MMNMMTGTGGIFDFSLLWILHVFSVIAFFTGFLFLLSVALKHLTKKQLEQWGWTLVIAGSIVCLFTISVMGHPWSGYGMSRFGFGGTMPMMFGNPASTVSTDDTSQEEAKGKVLYEKLRTKESACDDLTDNDFERIGEYVMGQQMDGAHATMNRRMKLMMGDEGEEWMHILLGRNATGCS